jgi:hypothetical protein
MRRFTFVLLILFQVLVVTNCAWSEVSDRYRYPGQNGIVVAWNGSWDIGPETTKGKVGYKYWLSNRLALKSLVTLEKTDKTTMDDTPEFPFGNRLRETKFSVLIGLENHFWRRDRLSFFFGSGIMPWILSSRTDDIEAAHLPLGYKWLKSNSYAFYIENTVGVEYFFAKNMSLSGQYYLYFSYTEKSDRFVTWNMPAGSSPQKRKMNTWNLFLSTSYLMFTFYL